MQAERVGKQGRSFACGTAWINRRLRHHSLKNKKEGAYTVKKEIYTYDLINDDGCFMDRTEATSFAMARKHFARYFAGKYVIVCRSYDDKRRVVLK